MPERKQQGVDPRVSYGITIKQLKKTLPKECSFLAPFRNSSGQYMLRYIVKGEEYYSSIPPNFVFTPADLDRLKDTIISKI